MQIFPGPALLLMLFFFVCLRYKSPGLLRSRSFSFGSGAAKLQSGLRLPGFHQREEKKLDMTLEKKLDPDPTL